MDKWEYSTVVYELNDNRNREAFNQQLNVYGAQGWELVSCFGTQAPVNKTFMSPITGGTDAVYAVFKRKTQ